jgi:hypothetical protein
MRGQQLVEHVAIHGLVARGKDDLRAHAERTKQLQHGNVEGQRGDGKQAIIGLQSWPHGHAAEEVHHRAMRNRNTFGPSGRS